MNVGWWGEAPERGQDIGNTLSRKRAFYIPILGQSKNVWFLWLSFLKVKRVRAQKQRFRRRIGMRFLSADLHRPPGRIPRVIPVIFCMYLLPMS